MGPGCATDADGGLITGDMAITDENVDFAISDRLEGVIKSGGEWISSLPPEAAALGHPAVLPVAAIGIAQPKWQGRPLLLMAREAGMSMSSPRLRLVLYDKVTKRSLSDAIESIEKMPMPASGKVHNLILRQSHQAHRLTGI